MDMTGLSKTVGRALRHEPARFGLSLDEHGWVPLEQLVTALRRERRWRDVTEAQLAAMVRDAAKQRYEISEGRIRALYGHSLPDRIVKQEAVPPPVLYHGTSPAVVPQILANGLLPMGRQYVHLAAEPAMALEVGRRKGLDVALLTVDAAAARAAGIVFSRGNTTVWLALHVPARFIRPDSRSG